MGGIFEFAAQVDAGIVKIAVQLFAPVGAFADIINDAIVGDPFFVFVVAVAAHKLGKGNGFVGDLHFIIIHLRAKNSCQRQEFLCFGSYIYNNDVVDKARSLLEII